MSEPISERVETVQRESQNALAIKATAAAFRLPMIMGKSYKQIMEYMQAHNIEMAGAPYTLYQGIDWDRAGKSKGLAAFIKLFTEKWQMEIGVPVKGDYLGEASVEPTTIPAGRYLKTLHTGPYQTVSRAYDRITEYAHGHDLKPGPYSLEIYLNDPQTVSKDQLQTEVLVSLLD